MQCYIRAINKNREVQIVTNISLLITVEGVLSCEAKKYKYTITNQVSKSRGAWPKCGVFVPPLARPYSKT